MTTDSPKNDEKGSKHPVQYYHPQVNSAQLAQ